MRPKHYICPACGQPAYRIIKKWQHCEACDERRRYRQRQPSQPRLARPGEPRCPVQTMGIKGYCNAPVVPGQHYCARHLRKQDRVKAPA